ncbi:MAG: metalloregulator ArsR/SmtB family transcription factor [Acidimicrobiia bacterium]|nr:metalloregulator ArsR/SmtB family transcription factor [Acidimicrobiia bacterium]
MPSGTAAHRDPLDVLGDNNRRKIVHLLGQQDMSVQELADALPISRPAVSRHLRLLKEADLVADRADGTRNIFTLKPQGLEQLHSELLDLWGNAAARFRLVADNLPKGDDGA